MFILRAKFYISLNLPFVSFSLLSRTVLERFLWFSALAVEGRWKDLALVVALMVPSAISRVWMFLWTWIYI